MVTGDGNCLFNVVSIALCGNEALSTEIRLRSAIEMLCNPDRHRSRPDYNDLLMVSQSYEEACKECCTSGAYSSIWTFMAITNVTGIPIQSLYLSINGPPDVAQRWLTTLLEPQFFDPAQKPIPIMWTNSKPITSQRWTANHFVPLLQPSIQNPQDISVEFQPTAHSSPVRRNVSTTNDVR